jgi:ketosteroid isomerase-like protein
MPRLLHRFLLIALLAFFVATPLKAQPAASGSADAAMVAATDPALARIAELRAGLLDAYNKKDVDKLLTYLHPDVVVTWQNGEVSKGRQGVKEYYTRMMTGPDAIVDTATADPEVEGRSINGDTSISYGKMNDSFKLKDGSEFHLNSRFSAWLVRDNSQWLVRGFHVSANVFDNEIQTALIHKAIHWTALIVGVVGLLVGLLIGSMMRKPAKA